MRKLPVFQCFLSFLIDFTFVVFIGVVIAYCVSYFWYLPALPFLFVEGVLYYSICYGVWRHTLGNGYFGVRIVDISQRKKLFLFRLLLRGLLTSWPGWMLLLGVGIYCLYYLPGFNFLIVGSGSLCLLIFCFTLFLFRKKLFGLQIVKDPESIFRRRSRRKKILLVYAIVFVGAFFSLIENTLRTYDPGLRFGPKIFRSSRPTPHSVKKYSDYLLTHRQNINDYIFDLFKKYDHVILCERQHSEVTQYEMIYDLVSDERFIKDVGIVFTEVGSIGTRDDFERFVSTPFANDTIVEKELSAFMLKNTAVWLIWGNTNWFNFLKKIYYLNQQQHKKVTVAFSDARPPWDTVKPDHFLTGRDRIMADNIISTVRSKNLQKSLIIMNTRHALLKYDGAQANCGYFIDRAFPGKVANLWINTQRFRYLTTVLKEPVHNGKWDVAFEQMPDSAYAFNLKDSPFGKDRFDLCSFGSPLNRYRYEDMFTGVIYYLPLCEHYCRIGYPYSVDGENGETLLRHAAALGKDSYDDTKNIVIPRFKQLGRGTPESENSQYIVNLLGTGFYVLVFGVGLMIILYFAVVEIITKFSKN